MVNINGYHFVLRRFYVINFVKNNNILSKIISIKAEFKTL